VNVSCVLRLSGETLPHSGHLRLVFCGGTATSHPPRHVSYKCNIKKSGANPVEWADNHPPEKIKSKYGEPDRWDGLSSVFVLLAKQDWKHITRSEKEWLDALTKDQVILG